MKRLTRGKRMEEAVEMLSVPWEVSEQRINTRSGG